MKIESYDRTIEQLLTMGHFRMLTDEDVAEIGNLLLVDERLNEKLGTKPIAEKLKILNSSRSVWVDGFLERQTSWRQKEIRKRTDYLAKLAFDKVWSI